MLDISLFIQHNASAFSLKHVVDFVKPNDVCFRDWSSSLECDFCDTKGLEYFREEEVFYNIEYGFSLTKMNVNDDCYDFTIYRCPHCGKWVTYID
jgi:hypothetical protein